MKHIPAQSKSFWHLGGKPNEILVFHLFWLIQIEILLETHIMWAGMQYNTLICNEIYLIINTLVFLLLYEPINPACPSILDKP